MTTSFLDALKAKSEKLTIDNFSSKTASSLTKNIKPTPLPNPGYPPELNLSPVKLEDDSGNPLTVQIERILNKQRLDIYFSLKPSTKIRELLKQRCFIYNPDTRAWYNKDTDLNRIFLQHYFSADFSENGSTESNVNNEPETPLQQENTLVIGKGEGAPEFERYKQQVNRLIDTLGIDAADLMLLAIDALYRERIGTEQ